jgi:fructose-1,6-bisphosphatase/inositol monophosphatase family enzyme
MLTRKLTLFTRIVSWDVCAGVVIAREAGGKVRMFPVRVAANKLMSLSSRARN